MMSQHAENTALLSDRVMLQAGPRLLSLSFHSSPAFDTLDDPVTFLAPSVNYTTTLQKDVISLLDYLRKEKNIYDRVRISALKLAKGLLAAKYDSLSSLVYRKKQVELLLSIQEVRRYRQKQQSIQVRSSSSRESGGNNVLLVQNEHFPRIVAGSRQAAPSSSNSLRSSQEKKKPFVVSAYSSSCCCDKGFPCQNCHGQHGKVGNNPKLSAASPWEGTEYKYHLLQSLNHKLLKKVMIQAWRTYIAQQKIPRQIPQQTQSICKKRLLQLCFFSIVFEGVSSKYIEALSLEKARKYILTKTAQQVFQELRRLLRCRQRSKAVQRIASKLSRRKLLSNGFQAYVHGINEHYKFQLLNQWSQAYRRRTFQKQIFQLWSYAFIRQQKLRQQLLRRFSNIETSMQALHIDDPHGEHHVGVGDAVSVTSTIPSLAMPLREDGKDDGISLEQILRHLLRLKLKMLQDGKIMMQKIALHMIQLGTSTSFSLSGHPHRFSGLVSSNSKARKYGIVQLSEEEHLKRNAAKADAKKPMFSSSFQQQVYEQKLAEQHHKHIPRSSVTDTSAKSDKLASALDKWEEEHFDEMLKQGVRESLVAKILVSDKAVDMVEKPQKRRKSPTFLDNSSESDSETAAGLSPSRSRRSHGWGAASRDTTFNTQRNVHVQEDLRSSACSVRSANASVNSKKSCLSHGTVNRLMQLSSADSHVFQAKNKFGFTADIESDEDQEDFRTSRKCVQRLEDAKQSAQLKKIQWLIAQCRRFFTLLEHRLHLKRAAGIVFRKFVYPKVLGLRWRQWKHLFKKALQQNDLLDSIYQIKLTRLVFGAWQGVVSEKIDEKKQAVTSWFRSLQRKKMFRSWRLCWLEQRRVSGLQQKLCKSQKGRVFASWQTFTMQQRRYRATLFILKRRLVQPWWASWRRKFEQKSLLKRVFVMHDIAWHHREVQRPTDFNLLHNVFTAWATYSTEKRTRGREAKFHRLALCFRGATLLARTFVAWTDFVCLNKKVKFLQRRMHHKWRSHLFSAWKQLTVQQTKQSDYLERQLSFILVAYKKRHILKHWQALLRREQAGLHQGHYSRQLLKRCFEQWQELAAFARVEHTLVPRLQFRLVHRVFVDWKRSTRIMMRRKRGLMQLSDAFYLVKMKHAFYSWPGYQQIQLVRRKQGLEHGVILQESNSSSRVAEVETSGTRSSNGFSLPQNEAADAKKKKTKIRLVDIPDDPPKQPNKNDSLAGDEKSGKTKSFLKRKVPTLAERAVAKGFIDNMHDAQAVDEITTLVQTCVDYWKRLVRFDKQCRAASYLVFTRRHKRLVSSSLLHWIALTPKVSYRVLTWIHNRQANHIPEFHDNMEHLLYGREKAGGKGRVHGSLQRPQQDEEDSDRKYQKFLQFKSKGKLDGDNFHTAEHMMAHKRLQQKKKRLHCRSYDSQY